MTRYSISSEAYLSNEDLRALYEEAKSKEIHFSYDDLDIIFEIALSNRILFPNINLSGGYNPLNYFIRWVGDYRSAIINLPHTRIASPKTACSDPAVKRIVMMTQGISEDEATEQESYHNIYMSAENIQGSLLEEYISVSVRPYGWIWCAGNTLRAVDFCSSDGSVLLQVKNKSNTENSSSSNIRQGTSILKWYRLGTRTVQGVKIPVYKWSQLNEIINTHRTAGFHLHPCNMTEDHYMSFLSNLARLNPGMITLN